VPLYKSLIFLFLPLVSRETADNDSFYAATCYKQCGIMKLVKSQILEI
jgi:hypothetical protein